MNYLNTIIGTLPRINRKPGHPLAFIIFLIAGLLISSCTKDTLMELNKGNTPLGLSVNKDQIILNEKESSDDALIFNWNSGSNGGTNSSISYTLQIDKQGSNFSNPVTEEIGKAAYTRKYSVKDLNDLLLSHWNSQPNQQITLEARVISQVSGHPDISETSSVAIKVTAYQPVTTTLFMVGDATPNGWSADNATELTKSTSVPGEFSWEGRLSPGELKFTTTKGQFNPSYNKGSDNNHLAYRTNDADPDNKIPVLTAGRYHVVVNLLDLTVNITEAAGAPFERLWIVGDATPNGWNIDNPNEMRVDSGNLFIFNYNAILKAGEFKIPVGTGNWGGNFYMPLSNHPDLSTTNVALSNGASVDYKWQVTTPGAYKIKLNLENSTISIKPFTPYSQIWMVGDATPAGWNIDNPTPLIKDASDPNIFTYTGPMNAGEFKFPVGKGNWNGDFFMPEVNGAGAGSTRMKFVPGGNPDYKWKLSKAGNYKIVLNQLTETITITQL